MSKLHFPLAPFAYVALLATASLCPAPATADPLSDFLSRLFLAPSPTPEIERGKRAVMRRGASVSPSARVMLASFYGAGEPLNRHTANGEVFLPHGFTAAHRSLPFGTRLTVCFHGCATVRVNDRGPAAWTGRSLDLSHGAARAIGMTSVGVARVRVANGG